MLLTCLGNLTRDPELREVGDTCVCDFTLASNRTRKSKTGENVKETCFIDYQVWDSAAQTIVKYCKKGDKLYVQATPRLDKWETPDGQKRSKLYFRVDRFEFAGRAKANQDSNNSDF